MAKARDIPGLRWDDSFRTAAAAVVRVRAEELWEQAEGVLDTSDVERVHAMRVASRRLRGVLEIFAPCFPAAAYRDVLRDVKRLADALGERRDPDVHVEALERFALAVGEAERPGIELLVARVREEQDRGNATLAAALERARRTDLAGRLERLADAAAPPPPEPDAEPDPAASDPTPAEPAASDPALSDPAAAEPRPPPSDPAPFGRSSPNGDAA